MTLSRLDGTARYESVKYAPTDAYNSIAILHDLYLAVRDPVPQRPWSNSKAMRRVNDIEQLIGRRSRFFHGRSQSNAATTSTTGFAPLCRLWRFLRIGEKESDPSSEFHETVGVVGADALFRRCVGSGGFHDVWRFLGVFGTAACQPVDARRNKLLLRPLTAPGIVSLMICAETASIGNGRFIVLLQPNRSEPRNA
jgi:hypothetical protein